MQHYYFKQPITILQSNATHVLIQFESGTILCTNKGALIDTPTAINQITQ